MHHIISPVRHKEVSAVSQPGIMGIEDPTESRVLDLNQYAVLYQIWIGIDYGDDHFPVLWKFMRYTHKLPVMTYIGMGRSRASWDVLDMFLFPDVNNRSRIRPGWRIGHVKQFPVRGYGSHRTPVFPCCNPGDYFLLLIINKYHRSITSHGDNGACHCSSWKKNNKTQK